MAHLLMVRKNSHELLFPGSLVTRIYPVTTNRIIIWYFSGLTFFKIKDHIT